MAALFGGCCESRARLPRDDVDPLVAGGAGVAEVGSGLLLGLGQPLLPPGLTVEEGSSSPGHIIVVASEAGIV